MAIAIWSATAAIGPRGNHGAEYEHQRKAAAGWLALAGGWRVGRGRGGWRAPEMEMEWM